MVNKTEVRRYLNVIRRAVSLLEAELDCDGDTLERLIDQPEAQAKSVAPQLKETENIEPVSIPVVQQTNEAREKHIQDLLAIDCWPEAVPEVLLASPTDKDQKNRASAVMDMVLDRNIEKLNFLDYGCGDGWITQEAKRRGAENAVGFDLVKSEKWKELIGPSFVHSLGALEPNFFDVVFLYDVLDHCMDAEFLMDTILKSMKKTGVVYVRCHPWTSRHATHLYKQGINKAYMHMFLSFDEIGKLIKDKPMFTRNEKNPLEAYRWWFRNFKIVKERTIKEPVSDFFKHPDFKTLLANEQNILEIDDFLKLMEIQFVDYVLIPK